MAEEHICFPEPQTKSKGNRFTCECGTVWEETQLQDEPEIVISPDTRDFGIRPDDWGWYDTTKPGHWQVPVEVKAKPDGARVVSPEYYAEIAHNRES